MKRNVHLYNKYFFKLEAIFLALDEKNVHKHCKEIFANANSEDEIISLANEVINSFEAPICKIGYLRELVSENKTLEDIFCHFIKFISTYPTRLVAKQFYMDRMTYKAIAKKGEININTVKTCVRRFRLEYKEKVIDVANKKNIHMENFKWFIK